MKNKSLITTTIITTILILSILNVATSIEATGERTSRPVIDVEKSVFSIREAENEEAIDAEIGDIVTFRIVIKNRGNTARDINVVDVMSWGLLYKGTEAPKDPDNGYCDENGDTYSIWNFEQVLPESQIEIIYQAEVTDCGDLTNRVTVEGVDSIGFANGVAAPVSDADSVFVKVGCTPAPTEPKMQIENYVKLENQGQYDKVIDADLDDVAIFKIIVRNTGNTILSNIRITDVIPDGSIFISDLPTSEAPEIIDDYTLLWVFENLDVGDEIIIEFKTEFIICGELKNTVEVIADYNELIQSDYAIVNVQDSNPTYRLTVYTNGNGEVTKEPDQNTYNAGDEITLTATPDTGWQFDHWTGGDITGNTDPEQTIIINEDTTIIAYFIEQEQIPDEYTLTININGNGEVTKEPDQNTYNAGDEITLTATPDTGWQFDHWTGGDITGNTDPEQTIIINEDTTINATFIPQQYTPETYTLTININGNGTITKEPNQTNYTAGTNVTLTATPDTGWQFDHWNENIEDNATSKTITINSNTTINATFIPQQYTTDTYTLTINTIGKGTITKNPNQTNYTPGTNVTLTAYPETGWNFEQWSGDINNNTNPITITINSNTTITAYFIEQEQPPETENNSENDGYATGDNSDTSDPSLPDDSNGNKKSSLINNYDSGSKKQDFSQYYIIIGCIILIAILLLFLLKGDEEDTEKNVKNPNENKRMHYPYIPKTVCQIIDSKHATAKNQY